MVWPLSVEATAGRTLITSVLWWCYISPKQSSLSLIISSYLLIDYLKSLIQFRDPFQNATIITSLHSQLNPFWLRQMEMQLLCYFRGEVASKEN